MKRMVLLFALLFLSSAVLMADSTVSYSTSGGFNGSSSAQLTFGTGANTSTITFSGVGNPTPVSVTAPTLASLGTFQTSTTGSGASLTGSNTFDLTIDQSVPSSGTGTASSMVLDGTLSESQSGILIQFTSATITINGVNYALQLTGNNFLGLVPPSTNNGMTTLQAYITPAPVSAPEPGSMALLSSGLLFFGFARNKKLKLF